jgi:putative acetyltransferase
MQVIIRNETESDMEAISAITQAAFAIHPFSRHTEQFIITALRAAGALTVSLVAVVEGHVCGHIAFSPAVITGESVNWYGMGPVSVAPLYQRQGIGTSLVQEGLALLKASGAQGCALVGNPEFYKRFGFRNYPDLILEGVPPEYFMALPFDEKEPRGVVTFHPGFSAKS